MYLVYLGESGNTGTSLKDPNQPHHVYVGLMVHEDQWNEIKVVFSRICDIYLGRSLGEAGTPAELQTADIVQGKGLFSSWTKTRRLQFVDALLDILVQRQTPLIVSYVDKQEFASAGQTDNQRRWRGPWEPAFSRLVFSLDIYMDEMNMTLMSSEEMHSGEPWKIKERAAIIADAGKDVGPQLQQLLKTEIDLPTGAVLENIHFIRSQDSHCTQLADMCAYFLRRWLQQPSRPNPQYTALQEGHVLEVLYQVQL